MSIRTWLTSSLERNYPCTPVGKRPILTIDAALNERFSFQMLVRNNVKLDGEPKRDDPVAISVSSDVPDGWDIRIRRVGYVPMLHCNTGAVEGESDGSGMIPGYVPDPLFDETSMSLPVNETHSFWFSVKPPSGVKPGNFAISAILSLSDLGKQTRTVKVNLHNVVISKRHDFHVTNWFYNDALLDFHNCTAFDETYWKVLPKYLDNMAAHGQDMIYVPVFTPPLDGVKRPTQLLRVTRKGRDKYKFDWRDVKKYISLAKKSGIEKFEWTHLFTQWGVKHALRIYHGQGLEEKLLWKPETGATSKTYRKFLSQFLPEFHDFLKSERLMSSSFFHLSDEPHGDEHRENYRMARELLREIAPWMKVMDALSEIQFAKAGLADIPVPSISTVLGFLNDGIPCWCYYCCVPRGRFLQRLMDTPLAKIRMNGWLFYRWQFQGFLHWGYNYWYQSQTRNKINPFVTQDGLKWPGWSYGDCFMVYPGDNGPLDSIRWEVFSESLQDYALLQTLGIERDSLSELRNFEDFPKSAEWINRTRKNLLSRKAGKKDK